MSLQALGVQDCDEDTVNRVLGAAPMKGASWEQVLATAQHYGVRATLTVPATLSQVKAWTDAGKPVMIGWNPEGREWSHASVIFDVQPCPVHGFMVHVADPNCPDPEQTVRVVPKGEFYSKWYEKFPNYLVRRPALMLEREVTPEGRQVMASLRSPVLVDEPAVVPVEVPMSKQAKSPVPVVQKKNPNVMRGEAPSGRNPVVQGLIERGNAGAGKHKNKGDFDRGHARNPKHKGKGWGAEYMTLPVEEACGAEYMQDHSAKFEEGVSVDPTKNMSEADAAEWKKQNAIHRNEFKTARVLSKGDSVRRLNELHKQHGGFTRAYFEAALQEVKAGVIAPAAVVGGGYKDSKAVAIKWLTDNMSKAKTARAFDPSDWPKALEDYVLYNPLSFGDRWDIVKMSHDEFKVEAVESVMYLHAKTYYVGEAVISVVGRTAQGKNFKKQLPLDNKAVPTLIGLLNRAKTAAVAGLLPSEAARLRSAGLGDTCWDGYEAVGMKEQGGKQVPNCVPTKTAAGLPRGFDMEENPIPLLKRVPGFQAVSDNTLSAKNKSFSIVPTNTLTEHQLSQVRSITPRDTVALLDKHGMALWVGSPADLKLNLKATNNALWTDVRERVGLVKAAAHRLDGVRGHQLLPATVARKLPAIYSQENVDDPIAQVKLFSPYSGAVWYLTEYDPSSKQAFGWADLGMGMGELGYIDLSELEGMNRRGLPLVERDLYWKPMPLSRAKHSRTASALHHAKFPKFADMNENPPEAVLAIREQMAKQAAEPLRPGDTAMWNGKRVMVLDTHGFPPRAVDVRWTESGVPGSKGEVANTKRNVPVNQLTKLARYDRGPLSPSEKNDLFESNPEFADMNENPPEAVLSVREQMGRQAARKFRAPF